MENIYAITEKKDHQKHCIARNQSKCATREFINKFEMDLPRDINEQQKMSYNYVKSKSKIKASVSDHKTKEGVIA